MQGGDGSPPWKKLMLTRGNRPTIYDVAERAGLSIATVSRVLNSPDKVNEATRARVMEAIDALGFVPKAEARARALQSTGRIGVLTPFFTAPSFVQRLRGVAAALVETHHELVIYTVESQESLKNYLSTLPLTASLDGLIVMSLAFDPAEARRLVDHGLQTVLIEFPQKLFSSVEIDDVAGGEMAVEYLLDKGHRRIAFLGDTDLPEYAIHPVSLRLVGYRKAMAAAGLAAPEHYIRLAPYSPEQARQVARELLALSDPPTAIFAATDLQAIGVLKAARELGLRVPNDLALIGFDDLDAADYVDLTTVRQPLDDSGRVAVELLLERIADPSRPLKHVQLALSIVERGTA